jgi:hypothetical protein
MHSSQPVTLHLPIQINFTLGFGSSEAQVNSTLAPGVTYGQIFSFPGAVGVLKARPVWSSHWQSIGSLLLLLLSLLLGRHYVHMRVLGLDQVPPQHLEPSLHSEDLPPFSSQLGMEYAQSAIQEDRLLWRGLLRNSGEEEIRPGAKKTLQC